MRGLSAISRVFPRRPRRSLSIFSRFESAAGSAKAADSSGVNDLGTNGFTLMVNLPIWNNLRQDTRDLIRRSGFYLCADTVGFSR